jgi:hypothetical protein
LSLKTTSATWLYNNLDIPEARKLIEKHSGEDSVPKIIDIFRNMHGTTEEQMFDNKRTLQDIIEIRKDDIDNGVIYLFFFAFLLYISRCLYILHIYCFICRIISLQVK